MLSRCLHAIGIQNQAMVPQQNIQRLLLDKFDNQKAIQSKSIQNKHGWYPPTEQTVGWKLQLHCHKSWENRPSDPWTLAPCGVIQAPGCCFPTLIGHSSTSTTLGCKIAWSLVSKIERPETSFKEPQEFVEIQVVYHIFGVPSHQYIFAAVPGLRLGSCFGRSSTWSTSWWKSGLIKSHRESLQVWKLRAKDATAHGISHLLKNCTGYFWWFLVTRVLPRHNGFPWTKTPRSASVMSKRPLPILSSCEISWDIRRWISGIRSVSPKSRVC